MVFGGLLTELSWRATLIFPGPVALLLLVVGARVIPKSTRKPFSWAHFDAIGAITSTAALLILVYAVVQAPEVGWVAPSTIVLFVVSAALAATFVAVEMRHGHPLLRLGILRSLTLVHANISAAAMFGGYVAFQFVVTLYLQDSLGWSPIQMALGFLPAGLLVIASALIMDRVLDRVSTRILIAVGLLAFLIGYLWFLRVEPGADYVVFLLPTIVFLGLGFAITFPSVNSQATAGVSDDEQGLASGLVNTSIQIGGALMMAVITAILGSAESGGPGELIGGMVPAIVVIAGLTVVALVVTVGVLAWERRPGRAAVEADPEDAVVSA